MIDFLRELRHATRQLLRAPAFSLPAILALALGIGASTAIFSVFHAMLLRSMGFHDSGSLVSLWLTDAKRGQKNVEAAYGDLLDWQKQAQLFDNVALFSSVNLDFPLFAGGEPEHVDGTTVTGNFFRTLGATPLAGRFFTDGDDRPGEPQRVVLSHRLWITRFGGDYGVVGRQFRIGENSVTVIGVARPEFDFPRDVAIWVPLRASWPTVEKSPRLGVFRAVARLRSGVSVAQTQAAVDVIAPQLHKRLPLGSEEYGVRVTPILDEIYGAAKTAVAILLGAVLIVLLIACANVANLLLVRAVERRREIAVRAAMGANRGGLIRLLLSEAVMLATVAGGLGLLLAMAGVKALVMLAPAEVPRLGAVTMNLPVLLFGMALTFATVLLFGLAPAIIASKHDISEALKQAGPRSLGSRSHTGLRHGLIASEVALSTFLLVGAALLLESFGNLAGLDPGFNPEKILTFRVTLSKPDQASRRAFYSEILDRIRALPGVQDAGAILIRPLSGTVGWDSDYTIEGQTPEQQRSNPHGNYEAISTGYFRTMGIPLLSGRDFAAADNSSTTGVVIVNEGTARRFWPSGDAVGKRLRLGSAPSAPWLTVVGVAKDVRYREWESVRPDLYIPLLQRAQHRTDFVIKTQGDPWALVAAVRREVFAIDKNQPISNVTTMDALVDAALARSRFNGAVLALLAGCALLLAAIGIYAVLSYSVIQRTPEIGIRMALGATPAEIARLVTSSGLRLVLVGAAVGLIAAAMVSRLLSGLLYGVTALDPRAYVLAAVVLIAVAVIACLSPALRSASIDPAEALGSR
ncbi:MAG TPA: ABC transporter permease [Bryobacteraceae bacterium]|nr:ABC transporter permease [Bryobacteraceae bacterium]